MAKLQEKPEPSEQVSSESYESIDFAKMGTLKEKYKIRKQKQKQEILQFTPTVGKARDLEQLPV